MSATIDVLTRISDRLEAIERAVAELRTEVVLIRHEQQRQGQVLGLRLADTQPPEAAE